MIIEAIKHFFLKAPRQVKALGFGKESLAIDARYRRCKPQWTPHLEKTKAEILKFATLYGKDQNIIILGSGSLLDVPIKELSNLANSITLVDILHLKNAYLKTSKFPNITLIEKDVTDFINPFMDWAWGGNKAPMPLPQAPDFSSLKGDLIISLNLISQLAIPFNNYVLEKKLPPFPAGFEKKLINLHINALKKSAPKSVLIGDISRDYLNDGKVVDVEHLPENILLSEPLETWDWNIAPRGEVDLKLSIRHKVGIWDLSHN